MSPTEREALAAAIASDLFTTGDAWRAKRLVLEFEGQNLEGPGWCESAVRDRIAAALAAAPVAAAAPTLTRPAMIEAFRLWCQAPHDYTKCDSSFYAGFEAAAAQMRKLYGDLRMMKAQIHGGHVEGTGDQQRLLERAAVFVGNALDAARGTPSPPPPL